MAVAIREATPAAEALLASVLRDGSPLTTEYPLIFGPDAPGAVVTVEQDGVPVAGCAVLERTLQVGAVRVPAGLVGSVATDPDHRGQGFATQALDQAESALKAAGCVFAVLWANDPEFYSSRGWAPIGTEVDHLIHPEAAPYLPSCENVRPAEPADGPAIHALYCAHATRVERTLVETERLLRAPNMTTMVLEREGVACGYACEGRGADLAGVIHEWGGGALDVLAVFRGHLERARTPLVLMSPRDAIGVFRYLKVLGIEAQVGVLGMGKLLSLEAAAGILRSLCPALEATATETHLRLVGPKGVAQLDPMQTLLLLAAPQGLREVVDAVAELTGSELSGLPLAPFCWGLDSI